MVVHNQIRWTRASTLQDVRIGMSNFLTVKKKIKDKKREKIGNLRVSVRSSMSLT